MPPKSRRYNELERAVEVHSSVVRVADRNGADTIIGERYNGRVSLRFDIGIGGAPSHPKLIGCRPMMTMRESIICVAIVPGAMAGFALAYTNTNYKLPWWAMCFVGLSGWLVGFVLSAVGGTIVERWTQRRWTWRVIQGKTTEPTDEREPE